MKRLPIRWQFSLWAAGLAGLVLVVFSAGTLLNLYHEQLEAVDLTIAEQARYLASLPDKDLQDLSTDVLLQYQPWSGLAIFDAQGRIVRRSDSFPEELARGGVLQAKVHTLRLSRGQAWRLQAFQRGPLMLVVAHEMEEVNEIMRDLMLSYGLSMPVVLLVAALGGWWVAGRALRPLTALTAAAESIRPDRPQWRMPADVASTRDEVQRLTNVLNAMLTRLEQSFQQSQRFAADASHELRTPLTIMRGELERLIQNPTPDRAVTEKLVSLQEEIVRLDRITEQLLLLARFDAGNAVLQQEPVNLSRLVAAACEDIDLLCTAEQINLQSSIAPNLTVKGDAAHLRRALFALLDNAVRYNQTNGEISCVLARDGERAEIHVRNTGRGIPAAARAQLFQRFFRVDESRSRGGHGLGLSLAREIVRAHRGEVALAPSSTASATEFVISLPLAS